MKNSRRFVALAGCASEFCSSNSADSSIRHGQMVKGWVAPLIHAGAQTMTLGWLLCCVVKSAENLNIFVVLRLKKMFIIASFYGNVTNTKVVQANVCHFEGE